MLDVSRSSEFKNRLNGKHEVIKDEIAFRDKHNKMCISNKKHQERDKYMFSYTEKK